MKRRYFLHNIGFLTGGLLLGKSHLAACDPTTLHHTLASAVDPQTFWQVIREQFVLPRDYIYLNTGGIGAVPVVVLQQVETSTYEQQLAPGPGHDYDKWLEVKGKCAGLLGPECNKDELALVSTATEGINIIINGLPLTGGDEVITSTHEHPALHVPLLNRLQRDGIVIRAFEPDLTNGMGNVNRIDRLINDRTRLIFISHITCTTGQLLPLKEIGQLARAKGVWFAVDGAQAVGAMPTAIKNCHIDFYAFSGHKWTLGPKRTGVLYVRQELLDTLRPVTVGAYSDDGYDILTAKLKFYPTAQRYEYATQNEALFHGLGKSIDVVNAIGLEKIQEHNKVLAEQFYQGLVNTPKVQILSPTEVAYRTAMMTFKIKDQNGQDIANYLGSKRIRVRVVNEANLNAIRVSFHIYNNDQEVQKILDEIDHLVSS